jgi:amidase
LSDAPLHQLSATRLAHLLSRREISAREVVTDHLKQIEATNPLVNAIVTLDADRALARAAWCDDVIVKSGPVGPLHGIPIAHKDLQDTAGLRTTYGSPIYADHIPLRNSLLVERSRAAGAICVGKTNTPEFGTGSHTYNAVFGVTRNPWSTDHSAGGSSGGAAAALAARMVPLADGSDMGGSLRNPASFCNVVGLRPSAGLVPSWPVTDGWFTLAVDGPMARSVQDAALLLSVIGGHDPRSPIAWPGSARHFRDSLESDVRSRRIAWCPEPAGVPVDPRVRDVLETTARAAFEALGVELVDEQPNLDGAEESFLVLRAWHYAMSLGDDYRSHRGELNDDVAWNIELGLGLRAEQIAEAIETRTALYERIATFMQHVDAIAMPVSQVPPFLASERWVTSINDEPQLTYLDWMRSCYLVSATGLPSISVPCDFTGEGLPVGLQLVGQPCGDFALLELAHATETAMGASTACPPMALGAS